jgi:hypothetical protein
LYKGEIVTIAGISYTATATTTAAELATAFFNYWQSGTAGTKGTFSGTKTTAWNTATATNPSSGTFFLTADGAQTDTSGTQKKNEYAAVTFTDLDAGRTVSVGGVSFTAGTNGALAADVAAAV